MLYRLYGWVSDGFSTILITIQPYRDSLSYIILYLNQNKGKYIMKFCEVLIFLQEQSAQAGESMQCYDRQ